VEQIAGGEIDVDEQGIPLGIFRENAANLIASSIKEPDEAIRKHRYQIAIKKCVSAGLTMVQTNDTHAWDIYSRLQEEG